MPTRMLRWVQANIPVETRPGKTERTFVIGHGMAIRALVSTLHDWPRVKTFESFTDNTSLTLLSGNNHRWQLEYLGAAPHLGGLSD